MGSDHSIGTSFGRHDAILFRGVEKLPFTVVKKNTL